jgi:hypothetical protein
MWEVVTPPNIKTGRIINFYISVTYRREIFGSEKGATDYSDRNCSLPPFSNTRNVAISNPHSASSVITVTK